MQCLFTHKMITDPDFHQEIYDDIENRLRKYDRHYRFWDEPKPTDHLVHYGFYTDDIARLININPRLSDCRSLKDVAMHFIFPNCAFKFRQSGPYKVDGVKEMVQQIYRNHKGFSVIIHYLLGYALLQLTAYVAVVVAYLRGELPTLALPLLLLIVLLNPVTPFVAANGFGRNSYLNAISRRRAGADGFLRNAVDSGRVAGAGVRPDLCLPSARLDPSALQRSQEQAEPEISGILQAILRCVQGGVLGETVLGRAARTVASTL